MDSAHPTTVDWDVLARAALRAREQAHAPYSRYRVGAALLASDGEITTGCNVENRSLSLTVCAERVAVQTAVAGGQKSFVALAVATESQPPAAPCGPCRQVLSEFCGAELEILLVNTAGDAVRETLGELLPRPFEWSGPETSGD